MTSPELEREAARWCRDHQARVTWSEDETSCVIEVVAPDRPGGVVRGAGGDLVEAYVHCRMRLESPSDDPPTNRWRGAD